MSVEKVALRTGEHDYPFAVIKEVVVSGQSTPYSNGAGKIAPADQIRYTIEVVVNGSVLPMTQAPQQPRPPYKVYSARKGDPARLFWQGSRLCFQVVEAPYGGECEPQ